jgi:plasmid stabilization system protein ParE
MNESATALTVLNNPAETAKSAGVDLVKYSAARHALIMACDIDEVLKIKNVATAAQVYAQQAQDRELIDRAVDLRLRAERKAGEMLRKLAKHGERDLGAGGDRRSKITVDALTVKPRTLADLGIKKHQSVRYQGLADLPADDFESKIKVTQDRIAGVKVSLKEKSGPDYRDKLIRHLKSAIRRGEKEIIPFIDDFKPDEEIDCLFDRMAKVWGFIARNAAKSAHDRRAKAWRSRNWSLMKFRRTGRLTPKERPPQRRTTASTSRPSLIAAPRNRRCRRDRYRPYRVARDARFRARSLARGATMVRFPRALRQSSAMKPRLRR